MKIFKSFLWGIPIGLINGFFGSGGGVVGVYVLKKYLGSDAKKAHATTTGIMLPLSCASLAVYKTGCDADWRIVLLCAAGGCAGALIGAELLNRVSTRVLNLGFGIVMIMSAIRMVMG